MHVTRTNGRLVKVGPAVLADLVLAETGVAGEEYAGCEPVEAGLFVAPVRAVAHAAAAADAADAADAPATGGDVSTVFADLSKADITRRRPRNATVPGRGLLPSGTGWRLAIVLAVSSL